MYNKASLALGESKDIQQEHGIWRTYDAIDGLPGGARCLLQDRQGYLWLGNTEGLHSYDGAEFTSYTTDHGLIDNYVWTICEDRQGRLWTGTRHGVSCFDGEHFINYTIDDGLVGDLIWAICEDHEGRLWFGTETGVSRFDGKRFTSYTTSDGLAGDLVWAIHEDHRRRLWFGTAGHGICRFDGRRFSNYTTDDGLVSNFVRTIYEDHQGRLWIGTRHGASCFHGRRFTNYTIEDGLPGNDITGLCEDHRGRLWLGTTRGVSCFDGQRFTNCTTHHGLLGNRVYAAIQDREGNLWFAHSLSGLTCLESQTLQHRTAEAVTETLIQDSEGRLWFGNENQLCCLLNDQLRRRTLNTEIFSLLEDSRGRLWVGTLEDGLYCYDSVDAVWDDVGRRFTMDDGLESDTILSLLEARDGTIWAGTAQPCHLCRFNGEAFEAVPTPQPAIFKMLEDSRGRIWMAGGPRGEGISYYDRQRFVTYTMNNGLPSNSVHSIVEDDAGRLWIGTQRGLCCFDGEQFITYEKGQVLLSLEHKCSVRDAFGQLWFGTSGGGLYRTDGKHFQILTTQDGLPGNGINGLLPQPDGSMIIGTYRGIAYYHPTAKPAPKIEIREVVADRVYPHPEGLELTTTEADLLTISYHGLSFATRRMRYSYIMEGYDEEWRDTWDNRVLYENLPVGEYTFKVVAINRDLVCSEAPATLELTILPDQWSQLRAEYETEIDRMQRLLKLNRLVSSQETLSDAALAIVEGLKEMGFDRAGVWIRDTGEERLHGLWGTDNDGNVYRNEHEFHLPGSVPPSNGYYVVVDKSELKAEIGTDEPGIFLAKDQDEEIFKSIWGYLPPCPGYYRRDERGDNIALSLIVEGEEIGIVAVDNYITGHPIDETSANLLSLVGTEMAEVLANVALRESLAQSQAKSKAILDAVPDLMFRISRDGIFLDYKVGSGSELYVPGREIIGSSVRDIMPSELADLVDHHIHKALESSIIQIFEYQLPMPRGIRDYEARLVVSGENEVLAVVRDITEHKQADEQIKSSLEEKEVLLKEIHHRVKNNLQIISSLLNLQSSYVTDEQALRMFEESQSRVRSMALIHEKLYQSEELARIDFGDYVRDLANHLFRMYGANSYGIKLKINVDDVSLGIDTAIPCGLIVNELVSNSLKYGFPVQTRGTLPLLRSRSKGKIGIDLRSDNDGKLTLMVSDDGIGFPKDLDFRKTESLGLQLVNTLTDQLEGAIELDRKGGTTFRITFADPTYNRKG